MIIGIKSSKLVISLLRIGWGSSFFQLKHVFSHFLIRISNVICRCIPFKYRSFADNEDGKSEKVVEVLMINANSGPGLLFPKVFISRCRLMHLSDKKIKDFMMLHLFLFLILSPFVICFQFPFVWISKNMQGKE